MGTDTRGRVSVQRIGDNNMKFPYRKPNRIGGYDYSQNGAYFITICTQDRKKILSKISVGTGVLDCPLIQLLPHGEIADKYIRQLDAFYDHISVDQYAIMPDHIHILLSVQNGQSGTPVPTDGKKIDNKNSAVSQFISTFKRFCNKEYGINIWQSRYYDHVIRNQQDYDEIWQYIENNPLKWVIQKQGWEYNDIRRDTRPRVSTKPYK